MAKFRENGPKEFNETAVLTGRPSKHKHLLPLTGQQPLTTPPSDVLKYTLAGRFIGLLFVLQVLNQKLPYIAVVGESNERVTS